MGLNFTYEYVRIYIDATLFRESSTGVPKLRSRLPLPEDPALDLIAARFRVLGESSRLKLIHALEDGEKNVTELVAVCGLAQANASRHLQTLSEAGILGRRRDGSNVFYFIADPGILELCEHVCGSLRKAYAHRAKLFQS